MKRNPILTVEQIREGIMEIMASGREYTSGDLVTLLRLPNTHDMQDRTRKAAAYLVEKGLLRSEKLNQLSLFRIAPKVNVQEETPVFDSDEDALAAEWGRLATMERHRHKRAWPSQDGNWTKHYGKIMPETVALAEALADEMQTLDQLLAAAGMEAEREKFAYDRLDDLTMRGVAAKVKQKNRILGYRRGPRWDEYLEAMPASMGMAAE